MDKEKIKEFAKEIRLGDYLSIGYNHGLFRKKQSEDKGFVAALTHGKVVLTDVDILNFPAPHSHVCYRHIPFREITKYHRKDT